MRMLFIVLSAIVAALAVFPAGAQTPGTTRVAIRNPDPAKWAGRRNFFNTSTGEFTCRPLACPAASTVFASISNSPTRSPDPQALANLAKTIPESVTRANLTAASGMTPGRKIERISSAASTVRGYPAIVQDLRFVGGKDIVYMSKATMFVKSALVNIASYSTSMEVARRNRDLFTGAMAVEDHPIRR